jgi:transcriptional regulator with XRE-family HTH domain
MEYGTRLRMMRIARGVLQRELEQALGLTYSSLSPIEQGRTVPTAELDAAIRRELGWGKEEDAALDVLAGQAVEQSEAVAA